jgi:hypothetical protein
MWTYRLSRTRSGRFASSFSGGHHAGWLCPRARPLRCYSTAQSIVARFHDLQTTTPDPTAPSSTGTEPAASIAWKRVSHLIRCMAGECSRNVSTLTISRLLSLVCDAVLFCETWSLHAQDRRASRARNGEVTIKREEGRATGPEGLCQRKQSSRSVGGV